MPAKTLTEFAATFDRSTLQPRLLEAENQRRSVSEKFPMDRLPKLSLEDYAAGEVLEHDTLAKMLAVGTPALGDIRGVGFNQVGIFKLKGTGLYRSRLENAGEAADDWLRLRSALVECCRLASNGQWEAVGMVSVSNWIPALRTKLLYIYFPDDILPMYVASELAHYLDALGIEFTPTQGRRAAPSNHLLFQHLRTMPEFAGWSTMEMVLLLREWFPKPKDNTTPANQREAILRAMRELRELDPVANDVVHHDDVKQYVADNYGLQIADSSAVMGYMVAPQFYTANEALNKCPPRDRQLESVGQGRYRLISPMIAPGTEIPAVSPKIMTPPALNQILYGPPGTGKTYSVIRRAAMIAAGRDDLSDTEAKQHYDELSKSGRIRLATFHQSFSYEDFIEGIRPVMDDTGAARFEVRDGVFKEIAMEALFGCLEPTESANISAPIQRSSMLSGSVTTGGIMPRRPGTGTITGRVWELADTLKTRKAVLSAGIEEGININTVMTQYSHWRKANKTTLGSDLLEPEDEEASSASFFTPTSEQARGHAASYLRFGPSSGWQLRADKNFPPYVLIIDEINRGNISRIFGELITLIEDDKRQGTDNALTVTLPTSREPFTVPPNLYLLGTMNTADKSLALLDVALRRRFDFEELAPDFTVCSKFPELRPVMEELNARLELRKDRDHRIGHAFFMRVSSAEEFNVVFRRKVVPLLQEYFFNDIDGARYVLGEANATTTSGFLRPLKGEAKWQRNRWRWFTDVEPEMDCWARLTANYDSNNA